MKKFVSMLLAVLMALGCVSAMAESTEYAEHYDYTASVIGYSDTAEDDLYYAICDMFNIDIEMVCYGWGDYGSAASMMINGGTMLDMLTVDTGFNQIKAWADQGLIRPLPEGWQEKYPNIFAYMDKAGLVEPLTYEDGNVYCIPHAIYNHMVNDELNLNHGAVYYRADWAEELGFEIGETITISELVKFAKACQEADKAGNGNTVGITLRSGQVAEMMRLSNPYHGGFHKVDGKYVYGPALEENVEAITRMKTLYNEGVIDPDFYVHGNGAEVAMFTTGRAAAMIYEGLVGSLTGVANDMKGSGVATDRDNALTKVKMTVLVNDEGQWRGTGRANYCWAKVFSWDMSEEKFDRLLQLLDWMYTLEGEEMYFFGFEDIDWYKTEDGVYHNIYHHEDGSMATLNPVTAELLKLTAGENGTYTTGEKVGTSSEANGYKRNSYISMRFWGRQAVLGDDTMFANPAANPTMVNYVRSTYQTRVANGLEHGFVPFDFDLTFYQSETKDNYSIGLTSEIMRIVADKSIPVENVAAEWNNFIEINEPIWKPLLEELNEVFGE